jgi:hypothetical protein
MTEQHAQWWVKLTGMQVGRGRGTAIPRSTGDGGLDFSHDGPWVYRRSLQSPWELLPPVDDGHGYVHWEWKDAAYNAGFGLVLGRFQASSLYVGRPYATILDAQSDDHYTGESETEAGAFEAALEQTIQFGAVA